MKAKVFDVVLHKLPAGKSPSVHLEEQLNNFLKVQPNIKLVFDAYEHTDFAATAQRHAWYGGRRDFGYCFFHTLL